MPKKVKLFKKKKKEPRTKIIEELQSKYALIDATKIKTFSDFPLSAETLKGLKESGFEKPSEVQRQSIGLALQGRDVLASAQTGSGKTLAFLIPVLETLYCKQWTQMDGLGALIITPSRELAHQIYETMIKIGAGHRFTSRLIIGGKDYKFEKKRMDKFNIIVCTPGRLLQHMDENQFFNCTNLQILVLDEADRCLDMGFKQSMDGIIENLPSERQTLLFSATLTKSVHELARLSLKNPAHVFIHEYSTPERLKQNYIVCELSEKMSVLWSFVRNHLKQKSIVFFQSCKQVKYINEVFCKMRPGVSLLALYGTLHQMRRTAIYEEFCRKQHAVLFATDIAARGLDFPVVDWVVQMDCPEDTDQYVHRAGRTARFEKGGESLLVLLPSELEMIQKLEDKKIPINKIKINLERMENPETRLNGILAANVDYKESAQRAFLSYIKSVALMKDKSVFDVKKLDFDSFARSLGLLVTPRVRFLQRQEKMKKESRKEVKETLFAGLSDDSDDEDILKIKRKNIEIDDEVPPVEIETEEIKAKTKKVVTKAAVVKRILKKNWVANTKTAFDDEGNEILDPTKTKVSELARQCDSTNESGIDIELAKQILKEEDKIDKERYREKIREKHREQKKKLKALRKGAEQDEESGGEYSEGESDEGPDLSWLPDPDKIYGKERKSDEESEGEEESEKEEESEDEEDEEEESEEEEKVEIKTPRKRRNLEKEKIERKRKKLVSTNNLQLDEALALQFLQNS